jgi:short-subunit dehydrogenase
MSARTPFLRRYGPWAVVTGASDGIGAALARELARRGLSLVLVARRAERLEALASELRRDDVACVTVAADLGTDVGLRAVTAAAAGLDVGLLVSAAGAGTSGTFAAAALAPELAMIDLNCRATAALTHHFAERFVARGSGGLVLLSSVVAFAGVARAANYAATKAYVQSLAEGLRAELGPHGVDVLAAAPGPVHSGFGDRAGMTMGRALRPDDIAAETLDALGRWGTARPGWLSKLLGWSLALLPRWGQTRVLSAVMAGMTRDRA